MTKRVRKKERGGMAVLEYTNQFRRTDGAIADEIPGSRKLRRRHLPGVEDPLGAHPIPGFKPWWIIHLLGSPPSLFGLHHREWVTQHLYMLEDDDPETGFGSSFP
jgi:hypothetical protein